LADKRYRSGENEGEEKGGLKSLVKAYLKYVIMGK